ncbi:MAG: DNA adenine methylase [Bacteroides sp.]|nr:DNA adenine methylase [Bacteroides sp.]
MNNNTPKQYTASPLPFQGQKRNFLQQFQEAVASFPEATTFVDLFGGSGLLAHTAKRLRPDARVVYNDFDNFQQRLENIRRTNAILAKFWAIGAYYERGIRLPIEAKQALLDIVLAEEQTGFVDYISLSGSLLFSMKYATRYQQLCKETFYNRIRAADFDANGYLDGLEVTREDYRALFDRFRDDSGVVFVVDPPYLSTDVGTYKNYWKLADYLDVTLLLKGTNYIYFTSEKSHIVDLCDWIQNNQLTVSPFAGAEVRELNRVINYQAGYRDMMYFRRKK